MPHVAALIRDGLKNQVDDLIAHNGIASTHLSRIMLIINELEITYLSIDSNGKVDNAAGPQNLGRCSDLRLHFKVRALNHAHVNIVPPGTGMTSFQPRLGYTFLIDADHVKMPPIGRLT
jgi:hypothetical protein